MDRQKVRIKTSSVSSDGERSSEFIKERVEPESRHHNSFFIYILRTSSNTLYIGQTNNLEKRLCEHKSKNSKSARYTRSFDTVELVYKEEYQTRTEAMRREWQLKQWSRKKKDALIKGDTIALKKL